MVAAVQARMVAAAAGAAGVVGARVVRRRWEAVAGPAAVFMNVNKAIEAV